MNDKSLQPFSPWPLSTAMKNGTDYSQNRQQTELGRKVFFDLYAPKPPHPPSMTTPVQPTLGEVPKPKGLFQDVLGGDLQTLYRDMLDHPDKYDRDTIDLVTALLSSNRAILPDERQKLDLAVYDYNKPNRVPVPQRKTFSRKFMPPAPTPPERPLPVAPPSAEFGEKQTDTPQAFWWLRNK